MATRKTFLMAASCRPWLSLSSAGPLWCVPGPAVSSERDAFVHANLIVSVSWLRQHTTDPHLRLIDARPIAQILRQRTHSGGSEPAGRRHLRSRAAPELPGHQGETGGVVREPGPEQHHAHHHLRQREGTSQCAAVLDPGIRGCDERRGVEWGPHTVASGQGGVSTVPVQRGLGTFVATVDPAKLPTADCQMCHLALGDPTKVILDARSPEGFRGEDVRAKYSGHIPGAVNIDWRENFTTTTVLKDPVTLKTLYASKGVTPDKEVIAHCQTGQRSSVSYWVLRLLGYPQVGNYARLVGGMGERSYHPQGPGQLIPRAQGRGHPVNQATPP